MALQRNQHLILVRRVLTIPRHPQALRLAMTQEPLAHTDLVPCAVDYANLQPVSVLSHRYVYKNACSHVYAHAYTSARMMHFT